MEDKGKEMYYPNNLCDDYSPSIPDNFPKDQIPNVFQLL